MEKDEIKKIILSEFPDIRSSLIKHIHDELIREYKEEYKRRHGVIPNKEKIDCFSQILLMDKIPLKEADAVLDDLANKLMEKIKKERKTKRVILGIVNTIVFALLLNICFNFIALYLKSAGIDILKKL